MIGRVRSLGDFDANGYINAEFEYSMPETIQLCNSDRLVIHPVFCGQRVESANSSFGEGCLGVYPHDCDPDSQINRSILKSKFIGSR